MKNILHTIDTTGPGGAERIFTRLATGLDHRLYNPVVAVRGGGWLYDHLSSLGLDPYIVDAKGAFNARYLLQLVKIIRKRRIHVIQSHLLGSNLYCGLAGRLTGTPVVSTFHGYIDLHARERFLKTKCGLVNASATKIVFVSKHLMNLFESITLLTHSKATIIHNGVDTGIFHHYKDDSLRRELGLRAADILVGAIGNIREPKAYDVLLQAAALLSREPNNYKFVIVGQGSGPLLDELLNLRTTLRLEKSLFFLGLRDDIPRILNNLDIFVLSSSSEGFSISTIEAMACQIPIVATRSGGPQEIVTPKLDGLLVQPNSPEALAAGIRGLGNNEAFRRSLASRGVQTARSRFSLTRMVEAYDQLYQSI